MEYKGISIERLNTIQRLRHHCIEPVIIEQKDVMKTLENENIVKQVGDALEKMRMEMLKDTEMSIVIEMAKAYLEIMKPHEVKEQGDSFMCTACFGWFKKTKFDFCPWCGKRIKR